MRKKIEQTNQLPQRVLEVNTWANGDSKMDYINQFWRFHCAWNGEISSNSELLNYQNLISRTLRACPTTGIMGWLAGWVWLLPLSPSYTEK